MSVEGIENSNICCNSVSGKSGKTQATGGLIIKRNCLFFQAGCLPLHSIKNIAHMRFMFLPDIEIEGADVK
jgi:hypothetical protein